MTRPANRTGDRVFGQAAGCLGSHVVVDARSLVPLPPEMGQLLGSTLPTAHLTAAAAFLDAANVQAHDRWAAAVATVAGVEAELAEYDGNAARHAVPCQLMSNTGLCDSRH